MSPIAILEFEVGRPFEIWGYNSLCSFSVGSWKFTQRSSKTRPGSWKLRLWLVGMEIEFGKLKVEFGKLEVEPYQFSVPEIHISSQLPTSKKTFVSTSNFQQSHLFSTSNFRVPTFNCMSRNAILGVWSWNVIWSLRLQLFMQFECEKMEVHTWKLENQTRKLKIETVVSWTGSWVWEV